MKKILLLAFSVIVIQSFLISSQGKGIVPVTKDSLGVHNGNTVFLFTLTNKDGNILKLTNYGARIVRIEVPDKNGVKDNITTGAETLDGIIRGDQFGGSVVGRYANRIANGKFSLDGVVYNLQINNAPNTLHGGKNGWYSKEWNGEIVKNSKVPAVKFTYVCPDMAEGFPGTVKIEATYSWSDKNEIIIDYVASTDKKTVINVTNHAYFNLHGTGKGYVFDHILLINASAYTPGNATKIPTGEIKPVQGTPFDFTVARPMGAKFGETYENAVFSGYDHNWVLDKKAKVAATVYDPQTGRFMEVITDQPGLQFYSGNGGMQWKNSITAGTPAVNTRSSFALETQHFPDSPNQAGFPSTVLNPGEKFKSRTIYRFSVKAGK